MTCYLVCSGYFYTKRCEQSSVTVTFLSEHQLPAMCINVTQTSKMACNLMPSFRCAMWIQHAGGGSAHVKYGVQSSFAANDLPSRLPMSDLTRLGIAWLPPLGSRCSLNLRHACQPRGARRCLVFPIRAHKAPLRAFNGVSFSILPDSWNGSRQGLQ